MARRQIENMTADKALAAHGDEGVVVVDLRDIRKLARVGLIARAVDAPRLRCTGWATPVVSWRRGGLCDNFRRPIRRPRRRRRMSVGRPFPTSGIRA